MTSPESQVPQLTPAAIEAALRKLNLCDPDDDTVPVFWDLDDIEGDGSHIRHWTSVDAVAKDLAYLLRASAPSEASPEAFEGRPPASTPPASGSSDAEPSWIEQDRFADFRFALSYARSHFLLAVRSHSKVTREEAYWIYSTIKRGFERLERDRSEVVSSTEQEKPEWQ